MRFSEECANVLLSIADSQSDGASLDKIVDDTGLPACQVVDLIENFLKPQIKITTAWVRGIKTTKYNWKGMPS